MEPQESAGYFLVPVNLGHLISIQKSHRRAIGKAGLDTFPFYCWVSKLLKRVLPPGIPNSQPRSPRIQTLSARYLTYTSSGRRISQSGPDSPHRTGCATGPYSFSAPQKIEELNDVSANTRLIEVSRFRGGTRAKLAIPASRSEEAHYRRQKCPRAVQREPIRRRPKGGCVPCIALTAELRFSGAE
jgi:hypothetical protein